MTSTTRRRVCSLTCGLAFRTRDSVPTLTPAVAATSAMFTRWADLSRLTSSGFAARAVAHAWNRFHYTYSRPSGESSNRVDSIGSHIDFGTLIFPAQDRLVSTFPTRAPLGARPVPRSLREKVQSLHLT